MEEEIKTISISLSKDLITITQYNQDSTNIEFQDLTDLERNIINKLIIISTTKVK